MPFLTSQRGRSFRTVCFGRNKRNSKKKSFVHFETCGCVWVFCHGVDLLSAVDACVYASLCNGAPDFFLFQTRELGWLTAGGLSLCLESEFWSTLLSAEMKNLLLDLVAESAAGKFL